MKNRFIRNIIFCFICILLLCNLTGCGIEKQKNVSEKILQSEKHYVRTLMEVPDDEYPMAITKSDSGCLYVVTGDGTTSKSIWSVDSQENWKKEYDLMEIINTDKDAYCEAFPSPEGGVFVQYNENHLVSGNMYFFYFDKMGAANEIELELPEIVQPHEHGDENDGDEINHIIKAKYIDGYMYALDANFNIYEIDITKYSSKCVFENKDENSGKNIVEYIDEFYVYDKNIMIVLDEMIGFEGIESHDKEEKMVDRFSTFFSEARQPYKPISLSIENDKLWTLSEDKISLFDLENDEKIQFKVVGTSQDEYVLSQIVCDDNMYAIATSYTEDKPTLYKYAEADGINETEENSKVVDNISGELKIWILDTGEETCSGAVRNFTDKYPDVNVRIEVGVKDGITATDAIKNLNADILAGNGPDIIYMDGMNIDKYAKSGELEDISYIVNELKESGEYFNNILDSYNKDGKLYVVPASVMLIGKVGTSEGIKASEDYLSFAEYIESHMDAHDFIPFYALDNYLVDIYYRHIKEEFVNGTIEREKLYNYFDASKKMFDLQGNAEFPVDPFYLISPAAYAMGYDGSYDFLVGNMYSVSSGPMQMDKIAEQIDGVVDYPSGEYKDYYITCENMAISSKSLNKDIAAEYIKNTLSEECQSDLYGAIAFRVNKKALTDYSKYDFNLWGQEDGEISDEEQKTFEDYLNKTINNLETVSKPMNRDAVLDQMFFNEMIEYLKGGIDTDAVVDNLLEKVQLYLSE